MIVIPAIDVRGGRAVRLTRGRVEDETVYGEDPSAVAARFVAAGARWLHVVDLDAALGSGSNLAVIRGLLRGAGIPVEVGGGLRTREAIDEIRLAGASRAVVGTRAVEDEGFLRRVAGAHGEALVVALDTDGRDVLVRGWTGRAGPLEETLARLSDAGAPRFLVTSVSRDGTLEGPDLRLYERLSALSERPVIASGGVRTAEDITALARLGVEAVVVGKALYEGTLALPEAIAAARAA